MTPLCSICGRRPVSVLMNPWRNKGSRKAKRGHRVTLKAHDLCKVCWRHLIAPIYATSRVAQQEADVVGA